MDIDFEKYRYFYDGLIVRMDRATNQYERLLPPKGYAPIYPTRHYDDRLKDSSYGFDDLSELFPDNPRDIGLITREQQKITEP